MKSINMKIKERKARMVKAFHGKVIKENRKDNEVIIRDKDKVEWLVNLYIPEKPQFIRISCYSVPL